MASSSNVFPRGREGLVVSVRLRMVMPWRCRSLRFCARQLQQRDPHAQRTYGNSHGRSRGGGAAMMRCSGGADGRRAQSWDGLCYCCILWASGRRIERKPPIPHDTIQASCEDAWLVRACRCGGARILRGARARTSNLSNHQPPPALISPIQRPCLAPSPACDIGRLRRGPCPRPGAAETRTTSVESKTTSSDSRFLAKSSFNSSSTPSPAARRLASSCRRRGSPSRCEM
jgi:hypothetical protein